jgi:uncharacterized membrane protein YheB (UPF0754 family)
MHQTPRLAWQKRIASCEFRRKATTTTDISLFGLMSGRSGDLRRCSFKRAMRTSPRPRLSNISMGKFVTHLLLLVILPIVRAFQPQLLQSTLHNPLFKTCNFPSVHSTTNGPVESSEFVWKAGGRTLPFGRCYERCRVVAFSAQRYDNCLHAKPPAKKRSDTKLYVASRGLLLACVALFVMVVQGRAINAAVGSGIALSSTSFASVVSDRFQEHAMRYASIPVVAGLLNWATNFLAVKMIFYPVNFVGLKIRTWPEQPFGLIGWTGIVPVKAASMASRMVRMVTSTLLDVNVVGKRVSAHQLASLLSSSIPELLQHIGNDLKVGAALGLPVVQIAARRVAKTFVVGFTGQMQKNIHEIVDLEGMVIRAIMKDKVLLVDLFQKCGELELQFVIRSGFFLGFLLGVVQMTVWMFWDPWWSLALGGMMVGYLTNFFAIKSIFEPLQPVQVGPWRIQGLFLTRQHEVSATFSTFFCQRILTAEKIWEEILNGERRRSFDNLLTDYAFDFVSERNLVFYPYKSRQSTEKLILTVLPELRRFLSEKMQVICPYMDSSLVLREEINEKMVAMSSEEFEKVLHPIFEEDELTLILVGAALGFSVGLLQAQAPSC